MVLVIFNFLSFKFSLRFYCCGNGENFRGKIRKWTFYYPSNGSLSRSFTSYRLLLHNYWDCSSPCCNFIDNTQNCNIRCITIFSNNSKHLDIIMLCCLLLRIWMDISSILIFTFHYVQNTYLRGIMALKKKEFIGFSLYIFS